MSRGSSYSSWFLFLALLCARADAAPLLPPGFVAQEVGASGDWDSIVALAAARDGRLFVAERAGRVQVIKDGFRLPVPFLAIEQEVLSNGDRGLLGLALDPAFETNGYIYLLYTVDPDQDGSDDDGPAFGRLARWQASPANPEVADPASRRVLLGESWESGIPSPYDSHTVSCLRFGADRSLLVGAGDGAHADFVDTGGRDPDGFGPGKSPTAQDLGAVRAQLLSSLGGKVLRVDPATGLGIPSNPFFDGDPRAERSRVWAYGLRNPFRFAVKPGTGGMDHPGTLYIGDVGWVDWEEVNVCLSGGQDFGWPCAEGPASRDDYKAMPAGAQACAGSEPSAPLAWWHHEQAAISRPAGLLGKVVSAVAFYAGSSYPPQYRGACFIADFEGDWIKAVRVDERDSLLEVLPFAEKAQGPVDLIADPLAGDLYYIAHLRNQIWRITYGVTNRPPRAQASASVAAGEAPLEVSFSAAGSEDPDGDPLSYRWSFGDGGSASGPDAVHLFRYPGTFTSTLTISDGKGGESSDSVEIEVRGQQPRPSVSILEPADNSLYLPRAPVALAGEASEPLRLSWEIILHHNTHLHPAWLTLSDNPVSFLPGDHDDGTGVWLEIVLRGFDAGGLLAEDRAAIFPGGLIVDDGDPGTSATGVWSPSASSRAYGDRALFSKTPGNSYRYAFELPFPGKYSVHAWWTITPNRTPAAPYIIVHEGGQTTMYVNQQENEDRWNGLGVYSFGERAAVIITVNDAEHSTCADAICLLPEGPLGGFFRRGDVDRNGAQNISDCIRILAFLFQGGAAPPCLQTADVDDNGEVNLTDAIFLLSHAFQSGPAPPEPFHACGLDPTADALFCEERGCL